MVTFLLTDIEGSTGLLQRFGDGYATVLRDVRALIRRSVRDAGGHEVDARADEFFAAFRQPARALDAAVAIQRALGKREWPDGAQVCVRIGIHTGRTTLTETGYVGIAVHTAARVCSAGHGGQILLSSACRDALEGDQPTASTFRTLGQYTLAGLPDPEALFQVHAADLRAKFPKLRTTAVTTRAHGVALRAELMRRSRIGSILAAAGWLAVVAVLGWLDDQTGPSYAFDFLYLLAVLAAAWLHGRVVGLVVAVGASVAWFVFDPAAALSMPVSAALWNAVSSQLPFLRRAPCLSARLRRDRHAPHRERRAARPFPARHRARAAAAGRILALTLDRLQRERRSASGRRSRSCAAMPSACSSSRAISSRWVGCSRSRSGSRASPSTCAR